VLVEQNPVRTLKVSDHVYFMQAGRVTLSEAAAHVERARLHELYFADGGH
jgi:branched-chain amino acid transport system ATP-binding protein